MEGILLSDDFGQRMQQMMQLMEQRLQRQITSVIAEMDDLAKLEDGLEQLKQRVTEMANKPLDLGFSAKDVSSWHQCAATTFEQSD